MRCYVCVKGMKIEMGNPGKFSLYSCIMFTCHSLLYYILLKVVFNSQTGYGKRCMCFAH